MGEKAIEGSFQRVKSQVPSSAIFFLRFRYIFSLLPQLCNKTSLSEPYFSMQFVVERESMELSLQPGRSRIRTHKPYVRHYFLVIVRAHNPSLSAVRRLSRFNGHQQRQPLLVAPSSASSGVVMVSRFTDTSIHNTILSLATP